MSGQPLHIKTKNRRPNRCLKETSKRHERTTAGVTKKEKRLLQNEVLIQHALPCFKLCVLLGLWWPGKVQSKNLQQAFLAHWFLLGLFMLAAGFLEELLLAGFALALEDLPWAFALGFGSSCGIDLLGLEWGSRCLTMTPRNNREKKQITGQKRKTLFPVHKRPASYWSASASSCSSESMGSVGVTADGGCAV